MVLYGLGKVEFEKAFKEALLKPRKNKKTPSKVSENPKTCFVLGSKRTFLKPRNELRFYTNVFKNLETGFTNDLKWTRRKSRNNTCKRR